MTRLPGCSKAVGRLRSRLQPRLFRLPVALLSDGVDIRTHPDKQAALHADGIGPHAKPHARRCPSMVQLSGPSRAGPLLLELHGKAPKCRPQQQATAATTDANEGADCIYNRCDGKFRTSGRPSKTQQNDKPETQKHP